MYGIYNVYNATIEDNTIILDNEIEFRLRRSIAGTEDLIFLYAENDWSTEELERQLLEKIDKLMLLYLENEWDMLELEKKLADLDRQLEAL